MSSATLDIKSAQEAIKEAKEQSGCSCSKLCKITGVVLLVLASVALITITIAFQCTNNRPAAKVLAPCTAFVSIGAFIFAVSTFTKNEEKTLKSFISEEADKLSKTGSQFQGVAEKHEALAKKAEADGKARKRIVKEIDETASRIEVEVKTLMEGQEKSQEFLQKQVDHLRAIEAGRQQRIDVMKRAHEQRAEDIKRLGGLCQELQAAVGQPQAPCAALPSNEMITSIHTAKELILAQKTLIEEQKAALEKMEAELAMVPDRQKSVNEKLKASLDRIAQLEKEKADLEQGILDLHRNIQPLIIPEAQEKFAQLINMV